MPEAALPRGRPGEGGRGGSRVRRAAPGARRRARRRHRSDSRSRSSRRSASAFLSDIYVRPGSRSRRRRPGAHGRGRPLEREQGARGDDARGAGDEPGCAGRSTTASASRRSRSHPVQPAAARSRIGWRRSIAGAVVRLDPRPDGRRRRGRAGGRQFSCRACRADRRGSVVVPPRNGWTAVYDELCDREPAMLRRLALELSNRMRRRRRAHAGLEEGAGRPLRRCFERGRWSTSTPRFRSSTGRCRPGT